MSRFRQTTRHLGVSGIAFLITLLFFLVVYFAGNVALTFLAVLFLIPLTCIVTVRGLRFIQRHSLWSVRNRLLFVYGLMGVLPIILLFILIGVGIYAFTNELALYLANSALERRIDALNGAVRELHQMSLQERLLAAPEFQKGYSHEFPGFRLYIKDASGERRYPPDTPELKIHAAWRTTNGLLVWNHHFFGWSHRSSDNEQITAVAPLTDEMVENLVPNLGAIGLVERTDNENNASPRPASVGPLRLSGPEATGSDPNFEVNMDGQSSNTKLRGRLHLPPAMGRFDVPLLWAASVSHSHLEEPNKVFDGVLYIESRPSAVYRTVFAKTESLRGLLYTIFIIVVVLFVVVELVAVVIGVRLSRRLTRAINQLYEGTRRVLLGDFAHRIPVRARDQLGELGESFNRMTANLERLFSVEKEKERMQTELEIAREVQSQLYPKAAPPMRGLKLSVQCDPARMVSGDYYDYQEIANSKLAFAIGDVAGKGISAALLMATLQAALRSQLSQHLPTKENACSDVPEMDAARVVSQLNKQIYENSAPEKYATFFFAIYDERNQTLTYTNAGHLAPLLLRKDEVIALDSNGTVVGAFAWAKFESSCLSMECGDLLVCYTDGITEPENPYGEMFGEDRLMDLVKKHSHEPDSEIIRIVLEAVRNWTGNPELSDDMTLLIARMVGAEVSDLQPADSLVMQSA